MKNSKHDILPNVSDCQNSIFYLQISKIHSLVLLIRGTVEGNEYRVVESY